MGHAWGVVLNDVTFRVEGQPVPKARPRVTERGTFTPQRTRDWEELVGWSYKEAGGPRFDGLVAVHCTFRRKGRRKADLDNLLKAIADGLNGVAYEDDRQVRLLCGFVQYGCAEPSAIVTVGELEDEDA